MKPLVRKENFSSKFYLLKTLKKNLGKNDGSVNGVSYFQTDEKRGIFLRPEKLEIETQNQPASPAPTSPTQRTDSERSVYVC